MIYKLHVRPHLDYGDIIYHKYDPDMRLTFTQKLEQTQYLAALAVTGTWRGTNRRRLFNELGWETLYDRRWYRRLCHLFSLINSKSPEYLYSELPQARQMQYSREISLASSNQSAEQFVSLARTSITRYSNGIYSTMRQEIQNLCFSLSINYLKL